MGSDESNEPKGIKKEEDTKEEEEQKEEKVKDEPAAAAAAADVADAANVAGDKKQEEGDDKKEEVKPKDKNEDGIKKEEPGADDAKEKKELSLVEQAELAALTNSGGPAPPDAVRPKNNDILFGRGKPFQNHPGNRKMLTLIDQYKQQYSESPRDRKRPIVEEIIGMLRQDGGRFLKRYNEDVNSTWWIEVSNQIAFDKVSHAFRSRGRPKEKPSGMVVPTAAGGVGMPPHHPHHPPHPYHPMMNMNMNMNPAMFAAMGRGMMASPGQFNPAAMEQFQHQMLEQQRRAAAFGFNMYGGGAGGFGGPPPGDGGFGMYPPPPPPHHHYPGMPPTGHPQPPPSQHQQHQQQQASGEGSDPSPPRPEGGGEGSGDNQNL